MSLALQGHLRRSAGTREGIKEINWIFSETLQLHSACGVSVEMPPVVKGVLVTPGSCRMAPAPPKSLVMAQVLRPHHWEHSQTSSGLLTR